MKKHIFLAIRKTQESAPRNQYMAELHLLMINYADELQHITANFFAKRSPSNQAMAEEKPYRPIEASRHRNKKI